MTELQGITVEVFTGNDGATVVQIDTVEDLGRVRIWLNEGVIYDGNPEESEPIEPTKYPGKIFLDADTGEFTGTANES